MAQEIERKFLVRSECFKDEAFRATRITQGYICSAPEHTVRVRIKGDKGFITIKGIGSQSGASRYEWEKEIPVNEADELLGLCESGIIDKVRHFVKVGSHTFEVDVFSGENTGLTVAEIELGSEDEAFERPEWLGEEVTGEDRYYNSALSRNPYRNWKKACR